MQTLTNQKIVNMNRVTGAILNQVAVKLKRKFTYTMGWNKDKLESFVRLYDLAVSKDATYQEYTNKKIKVNREFAQKDDNGTPIIFGNNEVRIMDKMAHVQAMSILDVEYADTIKRHEDFLLEEHDVELRNIKLSMVPRTLAGVVSDSMILLLEDDLPDDADEDAPELTETVKMLTTGAAETNTEMGNFNERISKMEKDIKALNEVTGMKSSEGDTKSDA